VISEGTTAVRASARASSSAPKSKGAADAPPRAKAAQPPVLSDRALLWRRVFWVAGALAWTFATLSLLSFHHADPPATGVTPHNAPAANWCGLAGAVVAHHTYALFGYGAWVLVILAAVALGVFATGRTIPHMGVRVLGSVLLAAAFAVCQALFFPTSGPVINLQGGLIGSVGSEQLLHRFNFAGTILWLTLAIMVAAIVTLDVWAVIAAVWTGRLMFAGAKTTGRAAYTAVQKARSYRSDRPGVVRPDDVSDDANLPTLSVSRPVKRNAKPAETIDPDAGGLGATESFDPDGSSLPPADASVPTARPASQIEPKNADVVDDDAEAVDEDGAAEDEAAPAPKKTFTADELRAKMAKLPVRFSAASKRSATEADLRDIQSQSELEGYRFPGLDLLEEPETSFSQTQEAFVREQAESLEKALKEYRIDGEVVGVESGPVITMYEVRLAPGTKVAALSAVSSDLARALKSINIRIVSNMAGRDTVGVEVPNAIKEKVRLKELMTRSDVSGKMNLPMFLGKDASGEPLIADLTSMPHMLIAGTTGSGKSVCMNTIIMSFLYTKKPNELKLVLVDPKMVELSQFKDIPHLMCPVVTEMGKAAAILEWAVNKMDERYELLAEAGCRDISSYNGMTWEELKERFNPSSPEEEAKIPRKLPYMVFVIDELADLMMTNKEVEHSIVRIAQKARAVGIHLILATQRPQANVVTGLIKSNMPARCCFKVASGMDSRIVLDQKGGELLLGQGDMLYLSPRSSKLIRSQGTLVDDKEIRRVVRFMRDVAEPTFERSLIQLRPAGTPDELDEHDGDRNGLLAAQEDPLFDKAVEIVLETKRGSVSMLQRRLAIGYTRSARLIEMMGEAGILGGHKGTVAREVAMTIEEWQAIKAQAAADAEAGVAGDDELRNEHPTTGETLEAIQHRVNAEAGPAVADDAELDEDLTDEADEDYEDDDLDTEDADDEEIEDADESDEPEASDDDAPPFEVKTRPPTPKNPAS
jgi:DNA segregation ATPase FtsK/SpoIIIE, S-DNA-T family